MNKKLRLKNVVEYSTDKISINEISLDNYLTTDNILQNKSGITIATNLPPYSGNLQKYSENEILVSNIRPYLKKIWFAKKGGGCSTDVLVFTTKENYNPKFIYYNLFSDDFFAHMMNGAKGTKMPRGDKNQILEYLIPDFEIETQAKIAKTLSDIDQKIAVNNAINDNLEALAKTIYDYWFIQFDFPDKNGMPYKASGGKMVWNEVLKREIPLGWEAKSLYSIANFENGLACQKYRPIQDAANFLPVIKIKEMNDGISINTERVRIDIPEKNIINDGDILFSWSATLDVKIWTGGKGALNQHIFKVTSSKFPQSFYFFELNNYLKHFKMMAELRKTTMGHITIDHLKTSFIAIPENNLIQQMSGIIEPILKKSVALKKQNQQLSVLRDWLLPMLMNGQVSVR